MNLEPTHVSAEIEGARGQQAQPGWVDRLVELHVLAENGDTAAAAEAGIWIASDGEARRVWEDVARTCDQLRAAQQIE
ncbi:hypothetical protein [Pseudonocardia asaccharolytica]|uniref:Uncharacterized protein n=1 Tax=Pseudonocardia asaccharolytica DSM 44247 = NBRC 16224 TaxID=1123024 RepID=A0A511D1D5_9PSEU|nr:hypothetical protein [Pseudonocardia asaccharolytica]GEL17354.1 hypothetical protein PA7_11910 [Pseudonocardia asaccharolytica DSM 44247 = NBRC 16224]